MCNARCAGKVPCDQSFRCNAGAAAVTGCDLAMTVTPHGVPEHSVNSGPQLRLQTVGNLNCGPFSVRRTGSKTRYP